MQPIPRIGDVWELDKMLILLVHVYDDSGAYELGNVVIRGEGFERFERGAWRGEKLCEEIQERGVWLTNLNDTLNRLEKR